MELKALYQNWRQRAKSRAAKQPVEPHCATLATLPTELLELILSYICKHCSRPGELELSDLDDGKVTLKSVSLACRALRAPAQAFLVHSLWLRFGLRGYRKAKDDSNFAVLRTLIECPTLAASVRKVTLGGSELMVARPGRFEMLRDVEPGRSTFRTVTADEATAAGCADEVAFNRLTRDVLVSLTHNLTNLSFPLGLRRGAHRATDLTAAAYFSKQNSAAGSDGSLPNLQILTLFPERGADFVLNDPRIRVFLVAAPNLRRLVLDQVQDMAVSTDRDVEQSAGATHQSNTDLFLDQLPTMHSLHSIHLQSCMIADDGSGSNVTGLQTLLGIAPNLRRFQFTAGFNINFHMLAGSRVLNILEPFYDTLVDLGLRYNASLPYLHGGTDSLRDLSLFSNLQVLRLDEAAYCHSRHPDQPESDSRNQGSGQPVPPQCLTRILPPTVQVLHLELMYACTRQHDMLHLAARVAEGRFPNLSHVQLETVMQTPPHGAARLHSIHQAVGAGWLSASQDENEVVIAFLGSKNAEIWMRNAGCFDDLDVEAFLDLD
ncbi:hypothetical protein V2A60_000732 [Cordyceps javanica]|uniref:Uncharacterized protein n=1 Tax=Cordyceps javanica TaxID=43265 RepID=A0A545V1I0_9HYPO|nr:hypothetical protein IF1G_05372 [Cordyceps javanica]TQW07257.1 f-box-like domain-containing protein [Cordyceps javanica]